MPAKSEKKAMTKVKSESKLDESSSTLDISDTVKSMLAAYEKLKTKNAELKILRKKYKVLSEKCKSYMNDQKIDSFDTRQYEIIHRVRNPPCSLSTTFIETTLKEYFSANGVSSTDKLNPQSAVEFIVANRKKKAVEKKALVLKKKKDVDGTKKMKNISL